MDDLFCHLFTLANGASVGAKYDKWHFQKLEWPSAFILEGQMATSNKTQDREKKLQKKKNNEWISFPVKNLLFYWYYINVTVQDFNQVK